MVIWSQELEGHGALVPGLFGDGRSRDGCVGGTSVGGVCR